MSCGVGCSGGPTRFSPEYTRQWKPENNAGCACSNRQNTCGTPSLAKEGSALWNFEQTYGKVVTKITLRQDEFGHTVQIVEKTLCPIEPERPTRAACCSVRYRTNR